MKQKNQHKAGQAIVFVIYILIGAACGLLLVRVVDMELSLGQYLLWWALVIVEIYVWMLVQIVLHETGHLVFGLATGYQFSSFRIGPLMVVKESDGLHLRHLSVAGTGGQCLMSPPDLVDGKMPYVLYNLGGALLNLIVSAIFLGLAYLCRASLFAKAQFEVAAVIGVAAAVINGVPMRMNVVDNDGYNAVSMGKNPAALRAFWVQMKANERLSAGDRLRDLPEDWLTIPPEGALQNSMVAAVAVLSCNRLMDEEKFEQAESQIGELLEQESGMVGLHRSMLVCDLIYCALLRGDTARAAELYDKTQRKFMKTMRKYPSVLRTEYAIALRLEQDSAKAEALRTALEHQLRRYPYAGDAQSERELAARAAESEESSCEE
jgi:hypothetical protein